jgi:hypothetical protein
VFFSVFNLYSLNYLCKKNITMNKTFKRILILAVIVVAILGVYTIIKPGWFMDLGMMLTSGMKHRNAATEKPAYTLSAKDLSAEFKKDTAALTKYIDKALLVEDSVTAIDGTHVSLGNVVCNIDSSDLPKLSKITVGQVQKIQGRLTTYNDLLDEIDLDQCVIK